MINRCYQRGSLDEMQPRPFFPLLPLLGFFYAMPRSDALGKHSNLLVTLPRHGVKLGRKSWQTSSHPVGRMVYNLARLF